MLPTVIAMWSGTESRTVQRNLYNLGVFQVIIDGLRTNQALGRFPVSRCPTGRSIRCEDRDRQRGSASGLPAPVLRKRRITSVILRDAYRDLLAQPVIRPLNYLKKHP